MQLCLFLTSKHVLTRKWQITNIILNVPVAFFFHFGFGWMWNKTSAAGAAEAGRRPSCQISPNAHVCLAAEGGQGPDHCGLGHSGQLPGKLWRNAGGWTGESHGIVPAVHTLLHLVAFLGLLSCTTITNEVWICMSWNGIISNISSSLPF